MLRVVPDLDTDEITAGELVNAPIHNGSKIAVSKNGIIVGKLSHTSRSAATNEPLLYVWACGNYITVRLPETHPVTVLPDKATGQFTYGTKETRNA